MIFTERTITVVNDSATINKPLILYRGDKNIELKITIAESQFKFRNTDASNVIETTDASYAQLVINTPYGSPIFSDVAATKNGAVIFVISAAMIDEIREVGAYEIQIRLLDDNKQSRASIPPVSNAIEIREPIAIEDGSAVDSNVVNVAKVNRALTTTSAPLEAFDSQGNYIKKTWGDGDPITDAALNKMEAGIDGVNKKIGNVRSQIKDKANNIDLEVERRRIDSFTTLAEGSTTGDAELIDARIGYNGVTYSSTGNAIRGQVSPIFDSISVWKEIDANSVQTGLVDLNNKSVYKDGHSCFIKVFIPSPVKKIKVSGRSANATYNFGLGAFYDSNDSLIEKFGNQNETTYVDLELNVPSNTAYILVNQKGTISSNYNKIKIFYIAQKIAEKIDIIEDKVKTFEERFQDAAGLLDNVEFSVFAKWGVIGDSLSVGYTTNTDGESHGRNIYYSWGQFLARKIGNTCLNFGRSGIDSKGWMSDGYGYPRLINPDNLCQCYIIALGANDAANVATVPIGTISDVDFNNMDNNADTVYGWYAKVINAVKTTAPKAPIFLFTIPYPRNTDANVRAINDMVREFVTNNNFSNLYLVDLDANYNDYFKSGKMYNMIGNTGWHLTALGYLYESRVIEMALSKVIYDNYQHFQNVPFIPYGSAEKLD